MNKTQAIRILQELSKRKLNKPQWLCGDFTKQNEFITSPSPLKLVQCSRRSGKSYGAGLYLFKEAFENPGVSVLYVTLTRELAKRIMFKDVLHRINTDLKIGASPNATELSFTLPNGSIIYLSGADAKPDEMNKLLGQKYKLVVIDEAAFFRQDLNKLVYEILKPAVADYNGTIALISTTSSYTTGLYYKIATGQEKGWSIHQWTAADNPFMAVQWAKEIEFLLENKPGIEDTPMFKRMYLNQWYVDTSALVYKFNSANIIKDLPDDEYHYVLGIDLGYNDATALVVCAYSNHSPNLYIVETFTKSEMIISEVAEKIQELDKKYKFHVMVVDNAAKQSVEEIKKRYSLPLIPADKTSKREYIELLNSDMITNNIKVLPAAINITNEWSALIWDETKLAQGKYIEHPALPNHMSDAFLYAWRWCAQYASMPKIQMPKRGSKEEVDKWWEEQAEAEDTEVIPDWYS